MTAQTSGGRRRTRLVLAGAGLALFAAGAGLGALLAGGSGSGSPEPAPSPSATPAPSTSVTVSEACVRAGDGAQEALRAIDRAGDAIADLDAQQLDGIIDGLQPLRQSLPGDVRDCRGSVETG